MPEAAWYSDLRERYRPEQIELLLIGESAPDPRETEPRFFYAPTLTGADNLFRGVVLALYNHRFPRGSAGISKTPWLDRLKSDRVFLVDLVPFPVNGLKSAERARARREAVSGAVEAAKDLSPEGIVICHDPTYRVMAPSSRDAGLPLLHDTPIPFPLGNKREEFALAISRAWTQAKYEPVGAVRSAHR